MSINSAEHYQQVLSTALEMRSSAIEDLVSDSVPLFNVLKRKGLMRTYSGPRIRQTLQIDKSQAQWYNGWDYLDNPPIELFNDAYWTPKMVAVPISLTMEEILNNEGENQVFDIFESYMEAAEGALVDAMDEALHSDGTGDGGKQLTGVAGAIPVSPSTAGTYGGINRNDYALWRTSSFDANGDFSAIGTQVSSTTIRPMLTRIMGQRSRNTRAADLLMMSEDHYWAYDAATLNIQRIAREGSLASLGFSAIEYVGGGRRAEIVLASGLNNNMPANTTYGLETASLRLRYNEQRNFAKLFKGTGQMPINQDAIAQFIGWMGELTLINPLFTWRFRDSNPSA
jgi:hypothetical protein